MLSSLFDFAMHHPDESLPDYTPLKELPLQHPPAIVRPVKFATKKSTAPIRSLDLADYGRLLTDHLDLGVIQSMKLDKDVQVVKTPFGIFKINRNDKIIRGKYNKRSLYGHFIRIER